MSKQKILDTVYETVIKAAVEAANKAGDEFKAKYNIADACGFVWFQWRNRQNDFYRWYKKKYNDRGPFMDFNYTYANLQEMGIKEVCLEAALKVFQTAGIDSLRIYSNMD